MDSKQQRGLPRALWRFGLAAFLAGYALWFVPFALHRQFLAGARAACRELAPPADCRGLALAGPNAPETELVLVGALFGAMALHHLLAGRR
jgi:hypothetical protein